VQASGEPARAQCLYERALTKFPVTHVLWLQYAQYLEQHLSSVPGLVNSVYARAVRNCPWVGGLWSRSAHPVVLICVSFADLPPIYSCGFLTLHSVYNALSNSITKARTKPGITKPVELKRSLKILWPRSVHTSLFHCVNLLNHLQLVFEI